MIDCSFELNDKPMSSFKMGAPSFPAFSGMDQHVNRAISQCIPDKGPIPKGTYYIFDRQSGGLFGSLRDALSGKGEWFALYAVDNKIDDETYCEQVKRGLFRLHPTDELGVGVSRGCITIKNWTDYQVIHSLLKGTKTKPIPNVGLECYGKVRVW